jgi:DNA topoisomerase VI subunit A
MVRALQTALKLPAYGLVDCGPFGLSLLLTYVTGSVRMGVEAARYTADVKVRDTHTALVIHATTH